MPSVGEVSFELERFECVPVEGGDKNRSRHLIGADLSYDLHAGLPGHLNVEKNEVGLMLPDRIHCFITVACSCNDLDSRLVGEHVLDALSGEWLIIGDEDAEGFGHPAAAV